MNQFNEFVSVRPSTIRRKVGHIVIVLFVSSSALLKGCGFAPISQDNQQEFLANFQLADKEKILFTGCFIQLNCYRAGCGLHGELIMTDKAIYMFSGNPENYPTIPPNYLTPQRLYRKIYYSGVVEVAKRGVGGMGHTYIYYGAAESNLHFGVCGFSTEPYRIIKEHMPDCAETVRLRNASCSRVVKFNEQ